VHVKGVTERGTAAQDFIPWPARDGEGLTGQGRLIQEGGSRQDRTIDRDNLTLSNQKPVTGNE
jgi:hypothetical protein